MPIIAVQQTALEYHLGECTTLASQINETLAMIAAAEASFVADGFKKPNIKALVAAIKKLNVPIEQVYFKNTSGTISISPTQVDAVLDANIRDKLHNLIPKDITATAIEKSKSDLLKLKIANSKNFGIPVSAMNKMIEVYKADPTFFVKEGSLSINIVNGFELTQI